MSNLNNSYVYVWKEQGVCGSGIPFYVGKGTNTKNNKYYRAYSYHKFSNGTPSYAQRKADILNNNLKPHIVEILYDNLTEDAALDIEQKIINRLGKRIDCSGILYNIADGGNKNPMFNEYVKAKHLLICRSEERIERLKNGLMSSDKKETSHVKRVQSIRNNFNNYEFCKQYKAKMSTVYIKQKQRMLQSELTGKCIVVDGIKFNSIGTASLVLGIDRKVISHHIKNNIPLKSKTNILFNGQFFKSYRELCRKLSISRIDLNKMVKKTPDAFDIIPIYKFDIVEGFVIACQI